MKKSLIKSLATLTLALSLVMTGAVTADAVTEDNYGISVLSDCPFGNKLPVD